MSSQDNETALLALGGKATRFRLPAKTLAMHRANVEAALRFFELYHQAFDDEWDCRSARWLDSPYADSVLEWLDAINKFTSLLVNAVTFWPAEKPRPKTGGEK